MKHLLKSCRCCRLAHMKTVSVRMFLCVCCMDRNRKFICIQLIFHFDVALLSSAFVSFAYANVLLFTLAFFFFIFYKGTERKQQTHSLRGELKRWNFRSIITHYTDMSHIEKCVQKKLLAVKIDFSFIHSAYTGYLYQNQIWATMKFKTKNMTLR